MALYNFQKRFAPKILSGQKRHTIRAKRNRRTRPGETCHLYIGLRSKGAQLLMRSSCVRVEDIRIVGGIVSFKPLRIRPFRIYIDGVELSTDESDRLARTDGFNSLGDMAHFWKGRTPFVGDIIHWKFPPDVCGPHTQVQEKRKCVNVSSPAAKTSCMDQTGSVRPNAGRTTATRNAGNSAKKSAREKSRVLPAG